jgi:ech hydrogenase subunit D
MAENQELVIVDEAGLSAKVSSFFSEGYRLVQIHCTKVDSGFELNYSFDRGYRFINLRVSVGTETQVRSISRIYRHAFLYENEISDLFGVKIINIVPDYRGGLYQTEIEAPFSKTKCEKKPGGAL